MERLIYGGYYSQDQLRDLVAYAAERHIEIIPEIDMPGSYDGCNFRLSRTDRCSER